MQRFRGIYRKSFLLIGKIYKIRIEISLQSGYKKKRLYRSVQPSVCRKSIFDYNMSPRQMYERLIIGGEKTLVFPPPIPPSLALF